MQIFNRPPSSSMDALNQSRRRFAPPGPSQPVTANRTEDDTGAKVALIRFRANVSGRLTPTALRELVNINIDTFSQMVL